jgi:3-oxoacyl-(acyl-carrier-protein) synthase
VTLGAFGALGGLGLITAWGHGLESLPDDAVAAAAGRDVLTLPTPVRPGDRYRRSTRESLLALAAVDALLQATSLSRDALAGGRTALMYATAAAYAASNRAFIDAGRAAERTGAGTVYFPYTAPSAVPAEVAIELGLSGAYLTFLGGAAATHEALLHAGRLLRDGECDRALVLAVETFADCGDLFRRGRWLVRKPLVEAAACVMLLPGGDLSATPSGFRSSRSVNLGFFSLGSPLAHLALRRAGNTLACGPLIGLGLAAAAVPGA